MPVEVFQFGKFSGNAVYPRARKRSLVTINLSEMLRNLPQIEHLQRIAVVEEAMDWLRTPYISEARVKGAGTDCAQFLAGVYINAGVLKPFDVPHYPGQWHLHSSEERYLREITKYAKEIEGPPLPGDIAVFHVKKAYAHAGIVVDWPQTIIHCLHRGGVQWGEASRDAFLIMEQRLFPPKFFTLWKKT
jgi:hypothetical protein